MKAIRVRQRFITHLAFDDDCVVWTSSVHRSGYGRFKVDGRTVYAHRWFWEFENGPIPTGLQLDHLCRNRRCVNLTHLEPVTPRENTRRGISPAAVAMRQTHCIHGHPFTGDNLLIRTNGQRACRICCRAREVRRSARNKELNGATTNSHIWDA